MAAQKGSQPIIFLRSYSREDFSVIADEAKREGIAPTANGVTRWAIAQFAKVIRERRAERSDQAG